MQTIVNNAGVLKVGDNLIYKNNTQVIHQLVYMRFSNEFDYILTLKKELPPFSTQHLIYKYELEGGDTIIDNTPYLILPGESFKAILNISNTEFLLQVKILNDTDNK